MGITNSQQKLITSLQQKKFRQKHGLFLAEGVKIVHEFLNSSLQAETIFTTEDLDFLDGFKSKTHLISDKNLTRISVLKSPNKVLGIFKIPDETDIREEGLILALDTLNDPGNLGTIIRLCDWFGISQLVCSKNTVDCYNPKVIQATMGSITRVQINYVDLPDFIRKTKLPVFSADMTGDNVYKAKLPKEALLVMGNEANGISSEINELINQKLTIPRFGDVQQTESLNVATATSILLSEFKRRII